MTSRFTRRALPLLAAAALIPALLAGCAMGPRYQRPAVDAPLAFTSQVAEARQASLADLPWWEVFRDERLQELIRAALTNNYDLRIAIQRVEQSREQAAQTRAQYMPQATYQGEIARAQNAYHDNPSPGTGKTGSPAFLYGSALWEIDLWGRVRRLNEAAFAQFLASEETRRGVRLSVVCEVAHAYFELLALDQQLAIARRTHTSFGESLRIFSEKLTQGAASRLETARAEAAQASTAATIPNLERQIAIKENQINLLLGRNPGPVPRTASLLNQPLPPEVPAGLPSDLMERRPDVRQAEQQLRAANAQIGVAMAAFFPKIGLTTVFGHASAELDDFNAGASRAWSVSANMTGPIFQGGALRAQYRADVSHRNELAVTYEQSVRNAFQEVANALVARAKLEEVCTQQARAVRCYTEAVTVSLERYGAGKAGYYEVLEAQQQLFPTENQLATIRLNRLLAVIQLYKALGGGWALNDGAAGWLKPADVRVVIP